MLLCFCLHVAQQGLRPPGVSSLRCCLTRTSCTPTHFAFSLRMAQDLVSRSDSFDFKFAVPGRRRANTDSAVFCAHHDSEASWWCVRFSAADSVTEREDGANSPAYLAKLRPRRVVQAKPATPPDVAAELNATIDECPSYSTFQEVEQPSASPARAGNWSLAEAPGSRYTDQQKLDTQANPGLALMFGNIPSTLLVRDIIDIINSFGVPKSRFAIKMPRRNSGNPGYCFVLFHNKADALRIAELAPGSTFPNSTKRLVIRPTAMQDARHYVMPFRGGKKRGYMYVPGLPGVFTCERL